MNNTIDTKVKKRRTVPNRKDVLDELAFIVEPVNNYRVSQRGQAQKLLNELSKSNDWSPVLYMRKIVAIYDGHSVEVVS